MLIMCLNVVTTIPVGCSLTMAVVKPDGTFTYLNNLLLHVVNPSSKFLTIDTHDVAN